MIDIVVPVHNALDYVRTTIETLYAHTRDFRLIVVDDYSDEPTREFLYGPQCLGRDRRNLYLRTNRQSWFTRASNLGLRMVQTDKAVLLNSDVELNEGWLEELRAVWDEWTKLTPHRRLGLVGHYQIIETPERWKETREPDYVTGHCLLLDMNALEDVGRARGTPGKYLDTIRQEAIHINSDRYLCYEMNRLGIATVVSYKAPLGHWGFKSWHANTAQVFGLRLQDLD